MSTKTMSLPKYAASSVVDALMHLRRAYEYARDAGADPWQFAVEWKLLMTQGLERVDARWLLARKYIELRRESNPSAGMARLGH